MAEEMKSNVDKKKKAEYQCRTQIVEKNHTVHAPDATEAEQQLNGEGVETQKQKQTLRQPFYKT